MSEFKRNLEYKLKGIDGDIRCLNELVNNLNKMSFASIKNICYGGLATVLPK